MNKFCFRLVIFVLAMMPYIINAQTLTFSAQRGFYTSSFQLTISKSFSGGTIRYTTNGTAPTTSSGTIYSGPITINTTTVVRAIGYNGGTVTPVVTHTYLFLSSVIHQPANISGWPNNTYDLGNGGTAVHDYEMDPGVVNNSSYSSQVIPGLQSIPSVSIVMDKNDFWTMYDGENEFNGSVEVLYYDNPSGNEQFDGGVSSHSHLRLKRSLNIDPPDNTILNLLQHGPISNNGATNHFKNTKIVLRGGNNDAWSRNWNANGTTYTRDEWYRASQVAVAGYGSHGTFVHLYVDGLYWGLYNAVERPDEGFDAEYFGGGQSDWLSFDQDGVRSGDVSRFNYLVNTILNKNLSTSANYDEFKQYLDVNRFCDYMIVSWMPGMDDWPNNNFYGAMRNVPTGEPLFYSGWDGEWSWTNLHSSNNGAWVSPYFESSKSGGPTIAKIWHAARANADFLMTFADRVYRSCFNQGAMTDANSRARWAAINNFISTAIVDESARWGDALNDGVTRTKNSHWTPEVNRINNLMNGNVNRFITALKAEGYYPNINPPTFNQEGGTVSSNFTLTMSNPNGSGTIYYTTNGSDPRLSGGAVSGSASTYSSGIPVGNGLNVKARVKNGNVWSALHEGAYFNNSILNLKINEFLASNVNDTVDELGVHEDWIEIYNAGSQAVNIGGMYITDALNNPTNWQIPATSPQLTTIPAHGFLLLWADNEPQQGPLHVNIKLSKGGEQIGLAVALGATITYIDSLSFGAQGDDVSQGRLPDGSGNIVTLNSTTPGRTNGTSGGSGGGPCVQNEVVSFTLVHAGTSGAIGALTNGYVINLATIGAFSIRADVCSTSVGSVKFVLNGSNVRTESTAPYAINGDSPAGNYTAWTPSVGSYTLVATPYTGSGGSGTAGVSETVTFTVVNQSGGTVDCNGVLNGTAAVDDCGVCAGGNTGKVPNADKDDCGICNGNNTNKDCHGDCFGTASVDGCGVCAGGNTGIVPNSSCSPTCVQNEVVSFTLMHAGTAGPIGPLTNGAVINLATIGSFSIRADVCSTPVGSVKFILNGNTKRTETTPPYALNGDSPAGNYTAWNASVGSYTLVATPYTGSGGSGTAGVSETVTFTIINQNGVADCHGDVGGTAHLNSCGSCVGGNTGLPETSGQDCSGTCGGTAFYNSCSICIGGNTGLGQNAGKDCNGDCNGSASVDNCGVCSGGNTGITPNSTCAPSCVHLQVISLILVHSGTSGDIGPLTNGMVINKNAIGNFNIRADVCDSPVGSVRFTLNGSTYSTESTPPYALAGDSPAGNYKTWSASTGNYTLTATPYSSSGGNGSAGVPLTVSFTVTNSSAKTSLAKGIKDAPSEDFEVYPNPNEGTFYIKLNERESEKIMIRVFNPIGQTVYSSQINDVNGEHTQKITLDHFSSGIYLIELEINGQMFRKKIALRN